MKFDKLLPDSEYEAAVRVKPGSQSGFKGKWSNWSKTITWRTHPNGMELWARVTGKQVWNVEARACRPGKTREAVSLPHF